VWRGAVGKVPLGTSLAAYPTARPVLNGGDEDTCRVQRALSLSNCVALAIGRGSPRAFGPPQSVATETES